MARRARRACRRKNPSRSSSDDVSKTLPRVTLHPHGLNLTPGSHTPTVLPLYAGTMHYWRHHPADWVPGLEATRALGVRVLDTYVPWQVHERERGVFDFGEK